MPYTRALELSKIRPSGRLSAVAVKLVSLAMTRVRGENSTSTSPSGRWSIRARGGVAGHGGHLSTKELADDNRVGVGAGTVDPIRPGHLAKGLMGGRLGKVVIG